MVFLRIIVLAFFVSLGCGLGREPALNAFGTFMVFSLLATVPMLYLLPTYEAWRNKQPSLMSIALANVFLGWTLVGWVVSMAWAYKSTSPVAIQEVKPDPEPPGLDDGTKACTFCAEKVKAAAIKCKHCGSALQ